MTETQNSASTQCCLPAHDDYATLRARVRELTEERDQLSRMHSQMSSIAVERFRRIEKLEATLEETQAELKHGRWHFALSIVSRALTTSTQEEPMN